MSAAQASGVYANCAMNVGMLMSSIKVLSDASGCMTSQRKTELLHVQRRAACREFASDLSLSSIWLQIHLRQYRAAEEPVGIRQCFRYFEVVVFCAGQELNGFACTFQRRSEVT